MDIRSMYKNNMYFCTPARNTVKMKLRKQLHLKQHHTHTKKKKCPADRSYHTIVAEEGIFISPNRNIISPDSSSPIDSETPYGCFRTSQPLLFLCQSCRGFDKDPVLSPGASLLHTQACAALSVWQGTPPEDRR